MWKLLATELLRAGHQVALSAHREIATSPELVSYRQLGGKTFAYDALNPVTRRLAGCHWHSRFAGLERWRPDILCLSLGAPSDPLLHPDLMHFLRGWRRPLIIIIQGNSDGAIAGESQRHALRALFVSATRIICVARQNAVMLQQQLATALPNHMVLPNPIRRRLSAPLPWPVGLAGGMRFATVARFETIHKRQHYTLRALSAPEWSGRDWSLSFFGTGPDESYLRDLIRYYALQNRVHFCGYVRDFRVIWRDHHLHILNSQSEGLALALVESSFCGRPAVITRSGDNAYLLRDGLECFTCPGIDTDDIEETLERAWRARESWPAMGEAAFHRADGWIPDELGGLLVQQVLGMHPSQ